MQTKTLVHFGAGNIGRSLVGPIFSRAGYEVVFVDAEATIVNALNERREYAVVVKDDLPAGAVDRVTVTNVRGILASDVDAVAAVVARADLLSTAVGAGILPRLAAVLAQGLEQRDTPVSILLCENARGAAEILRVALAAHVSDSFRLRERLGCVETSIGKMVPIMPERVRRDDPLEIWAEAYHCIIADAAGFIGAPPAAEGLVLKQHFSAYVDRKLFIHNLGHGAAAYYGALAGYTFIWEAMADAALQKNVREVMREAGRALVREYAAELTDLEVNAHIDDLIQRFQNRVLGDTVYRVGRDLYRKLGAEDRCVGALRLVRRHGGNPKPIARVIAAALCFRARDENGAAWSDDIRFREQFAEAGGESVLQNVCGLSKLGDGTLIEMIMQEYAALKNRPTAD